MERFPRGSIPPSTFAAVATLAPTAIAKPPAIATSQASEGDADTDTSICPTKQCDLSTTCPNCNAQMQPEHAHYRCGECGYRDSCCF